jgi:hypothetical protein
MPSCNGYGRPCIIALAQHPRFELVVLPARYEATDGQPIGLVGQGPIASGSRAYLFQRQKIARPSVETAMPKFLVGSVALVIAMLPAIAIAQKTSPDSPSTQSIQPSSPNSGAEIPGQPGNKSGRAPMQTASLLRICRRFPGSPEAKAVRRPDRHPVGNNQTRDFQQLDRSPQRYSQKPLSCRAQIFV